MTFNKTLHDVKAKKEDVLSFTEDTLSALRALTAPSLNYWAFGPAKYQFNANPETIERSESPQV